MPSSINLICLESIFQIIFVDCASFELAINSLQHLFGVNPFVSKLSTNPLSSQHPPLSSKYVVISDSVFIL